MRRFDPIKSNLRSCFFQQLLQGYRPLPGNHSIHSSCGDEHLLTGSFGVFSGVKGSIALNNIALLRASGLRSSRLAPMLAPFEYPRATTEEGSKPYTLEALETNSASSAVRNFRSAMSKTPSANRRKKRGIPFSNTLPLGLRIAAFPSIILASEKRSVSSPPVPWRTNRVVVFPLLPGKNR